jgi:hypothetical protein
MALDGTEYGAEVSVSGGRVGTMELVKGSGDNALPALYRPTLRRMYDRMLELREDIDAMNKELGCW